MKKYLYILLLPFVLGSCIKDGLDNYPVFDEAEITDFDLEYRYVQTNNYGVEQLAVITLNTTVNINEGSATIVVDAVVPGATDSFPESERSKVSLSDIVAYTKLSPAAKIEPVNGAPILGAPGDFSTSREYKVTAADGKTVKNWTITVQSLTL